MKEQLLDELRKAGNDVETTLDRIGGNVDAYRRFLEKFLEDKNYSQLVEHMKTGDTGEAFVFAHTLKGLTGNLGLDRLYANLDYLVMIFRKQREGDPELLMKMITEEYEKVCDIIRANL